MLEGFTALEIIHGTTKPSPIGRESQQSADGAREQFRQRSCLGAMVEHVTIGALAQTVQVNADPFGQRSDALTSGLV